MTRIDDTFPDVGFIPTVIIVTIVGLALQLSGAWITMLLAGMFGALFTRTYLKSFLAGFFGTAAAWGILYLYLSLTAQASAIAEFFIGLLGLTGMGWLVFVIAMLFGGLLGGFGGGSDGPYMKWLTNSWHPQYQAIYLNLQKQCEFRLMQLCS